MRNRKRGSPQTNRPKSGGLLATSVPPPSPGIAKYLNAFMDIFQNGAPAFASDDLSDAEVVLSATAILDHMLRLAVITMFRSTLSSTALASIFEGDGPLSTFDSKIRMCLGFRLIGDAVKHDLEILRTVRNRFAHSPVPKHFTDFDIDTRCARLKCPGLHDAEALKFLRGEDIANMKYYADIIPDVPVDAEEVTKYIDEMKRQTPRRLFVRSAAIIMSSLVVDITFSAKALILVGQNWNDLVDQAMSEVAEVNKKSLLKNITELKDA